MEHARHRASRKESLRSINEALEVLNDAAEESADEIRKMVSSDYRKLKNALNSIQPEVRTAISDAKDHITTITKDTAQRVDDSAHENPWTFIGAAAAVGAFAGFLLGRQAKE